MGSILLFFFFFWVHILQQLDVYLPTWLSEVHHQSNCLGVKILTRWILTRWMTRGPKFSNSRLRFPPFDTYAQPWHSPTHSYCLSVNTNAHAVCSHVCSAPPRLRGSLHTTWGYARPCTDLRVDISPHFSSMRLRACPAPPRLCGSFPI